MNPPTDPAAVIGLSVRFTNGKNKGFQGVVHWAGEVCCSVVVVMDGRPVEFIEGYPCLTPISELAAQGDAT